MNYLVLAWAIMVGISFTIFVLNLIAFLQDVNRKHFRFLCMCLVTLAVCIFGYIEIRLMTATSAENALPYLRMGHPVVFAMFIGLALYVQDHFGTGRLWLLGVVIVARCVVLAIDIASEVNINYLAVTSLRTVSFLGENVAVVGDAVPNPWSRLAPFTAILFLVYVVDASVALWRKGGVIARKRALLVGGGIVFTVVSAACIGFLKHEGILDWPYIIAPSFMVVVMIVTYELVEDAMRVEKLEVELQSTHHELGMATRQLHMAHNAADIGTWMWNKKTNEMILSERGSQLLRIPAGETITADSFLEKFHPDSQEVISSIFKNATSDGSEIDVWTRLNDSNGGLRWIGLRGGVIPDASGSNLGFVGVLQDVTDRKASDHRIRLIAEAFPVGVLIVSEAGSIQFANKRLESMFGYENGQLDGLSMEVLVPEMLRERHLEVRKAFQSKHISRAMLEGRDVAGVRKDGGKIMVEVWLATETIQGKVITIASVIDNSGSRQMESELSRRREEIAHLSRVAMLGELSGSLAHELNQPLTAILSNAQATQELRSQGRLTPDTLDEILGDIVSDTRRAGEVIKRVRTLLRRGEIVLERVDLNSVVLEVLRLMSSNLIDGHIVVKTMLAPELPAVLGDRVQLQQVILNLLLNACEAMADMMDRREIFVRTDLHPPFGVRVSIIDNGGGIPVDSLETVFEPFVTTKSQGMGLGLSVCRSIIQQHGGTIGAENNAPRGAIFYFTLRIAPEDQ